MNCDARRRNLLLLVPLLLLLASAPSCGSVDVDDVLDKAGGLVDDAGKMVKDVIGDAGGDATGDTPGGDRNVSRPPRPSGTITTGPPLVLTSQVVGTAGGSVKVQKPGDPLDGLEIDVPTGSYPDDRQFNVSSTPVNGHDFGEYFTPATPLITIENGGDYADEFMTVRIPVEIPSDHFAMAFYYDEATGTLEAIPFNGMSGQSITIVTRHFSSLLVSIISNTALDDLMKGDIDSYFRPGIDDWQFTNYGSYIARGGHCAGQSLSALWYFCEQPDGQDLTLNGRYDKNGVKPATPDLWQDDSNGYRLASTLQEDINWSSFENKLMVNLAGQDDELAFKAFAYSLQLTGEPQEVGIFSSAGGGHDMICYRVHNDSLYIADPNYPGNTDRRIEFSNGSFKPYNSGANAAEIEAGNGKSYETVQFCAKSATIDWKSIAGRWNEFKAGTIGDDRFPRCDVVLLDDKGGAEPLVDGYKSETKKIAIAVNAGIPIGAKIYRNGTKIVRDANGKYELEEGTNVLGVEIWGDVNNNPQAPDYCYIDFQYFNVQYGEDEECHGWVLDSVTHVDEPFPFYPPTQLDYKWETIDGSYSASGGMTMSTIEDPDPIATFSESGTWSPLPTCIDPTKPVRFTARLVTTVQFDRPYQMESGGFFNTIWVHVNTVGTSEIWLHHEANSAAPVVDETKTWDLWLNENPENIPDATQVVIVQLTSDTGKSEYRYNYVWRE